MWGIRLVVLAFCTVACSGCLPSPTVACGDGTVCGGGTSCVDIGIDEVDFRCATKAQLDECNDLEQNAVCQTVDGKPGTCISDTKVCIEDICGDGIPAATEKCDDHNLTGGDGCSRDCQSDETCGNGVVDGSASEECDSGVPGLSGDGCSSGCFAEARQWIDRRAKVIPPLDSHRMVYDSKRKKVVLFGGIENQRFTDQTWEYDGEVWSTHVFPVAPGRRAGHQMVFDTLRGVTVLFGGSDGTDYQNDTWEFDGITWTKLELATLPTARRGHAMAYDTRRHRIVMFGGNTANGELNDTWVFENSTWTEVTTIGSPPHRRGAAMAFDAARNKFVLVGGSDMQTSFDDVWELTDATWAAAGSMPVSNLTTYQLVYDNAVNATVALAGSLLPGGPSQVFFYNGTTWTAGPTGPKNRIKAALAFDSTTHKSILFGGELHSRSESSPSINDTWTLANGEWQLIDTSVRGPEIVDGAFAFDSKRGTAVVVGGRVSLAVKNDTWIFDGRSWRIAAPANQTTLSHAMVFDSHRGGMILFGGITRLSSYVTAVDTTEFYDGQNWTMVMPPTRPAARSEHAMAYDAERKRTVLFGGVVSDGVNYNNGDDTWVFDETGTWREVVPATRPPPRRLHAMAYDGKRKRVVLFGGTSARPLNIGAKLNDTWEFDGTTWTLWPPTDDNMPSARQGAAMAFDAKRGVIVLRGGVDASGATNEVWEFNGERWIQQFPLNPPPAVEVANLTFDSVTNTILMFDGETLPTEQTADLRSYTFAAAHPAEQCVVDEDADHDDLSACDDPDCVGRCYPNCAATYGDCDRNVGPHCGDGTCNPTFEDYLLCPGDCQR